MQMIVGNFIYLKIYYLQLFNIHQRDNMKRCFEKNTQDKIGGGGEEKKKNRKILKMMKKNLFHYPHGVRKILRKTN